MYVSEEKMMMEHIVLLDESGNEIGEADKLRAHHSHTPLHRAFSCYIFNQDGQFLVTQRALSKKVWPGVWTNSVCGHPAPGEAYEDAIVRRAHDELGMDIKDIRLVLPNYRYVTPAFQGIIENEMCPVFVARQASDVVPNPDEVEAYKWMPWEGYLEALRDHADLYSYWTKEQSALLQTSSIFTKYRIG